MFHIEDVLQLRENEHVELIVRRHIATLIPKLLLAIVLIVLPFFLLFPLFGLGLLGVIVFGGAVLFGIGLAVRTFLLWDADVFIVTSFRVLDVDQKGMFARSVAEAQLSNIQDISWKRTGMFETIFRMGTLTVQTAGSTTAMNATKVSSPEKIADFINEFRHAAPPKKASNIDPAKHDKLKSIIELLKGFSEEELVRIEMILKQRERAVVTEAFLGSEDKDEADVTDEK